MNRHDPAGPAGKQPPPAGAGRNTGGTGPALALRNWRVPFRVLALVTIPVVMGVVFAGLRVAVAAGDAATFGRVEKLAVLGQQVTGLAQAMEDERDLTAVYIADGRPASGLAALRRQYAVTSTWAGRVRTMVADLGPGYPAQLQGALSAVQARITDLPDLRDFATTSQLPALTAVIDYSLATGDLFSLNDQIAQEGGDAALLASVRTLGALSRMKDEASQQGAILYAALTSKRFGPGLLNALTAAQAQQASALASFTTSATLSEQQHFENAVAGPRVDQAQAIEQRAIVLGSGGHPLALAASTAPQWQADMAYTVGRMRLVERQLAGLIAAHAQALHAGAARSAELAGGAALAALLLVLLAAVVIARSMVLPLRRLKADALEIAGLRLPREVRELAATAETGQTIEVAPVGVSSTDEIGQVARAFDRVHAEAVRLAGEEARLRGSVNAMFVSLSRRSQSLLERLLRLIDSLELGEEDPDRLASLFQMDHLATRMRRHSENLLVLAGHDAPRRWAEPVPLVDVARAAVSEIEQYERVDLDIQPDITVAGNAVADTVHLLAEIIENATAFSAGSTRVSVSGHALTSGGVMISITDSGMGITGQQLALLNWRLENPPVADVAVSRHMGLFAVAHLAARHSIRVRLQAPATGGITALVWLPDGLASQARAPAARERPAAWERPAGRPAAGVIRTATPRTPAARTPAARAGAAGAAEPAGTGAELPIFGSVESDWFRARGRRIRDTRPAAPQPPRSRTSPADEGWRAAGTALSPAVGGVTGAGLPRRVPQANLIPGSAGNGGSGRAPAPEPAEVVRKRLAGFQHGARRARGNTPGAAPPAE